MQGREHVTATPDIIYGRLLESVHLSGYAFERWVAELDYLLTEDRWRRVGPGFTDIDVFMRTLDLSSFNLKDKRPKMIRRIKALQATVSNRAIADALGVSEMTVRRDLMPATTVAPTPADEALEADSEHAPATTVARTRLQEALLFAAEWEAVWLKWQPLIQADEGAMPPADIDLLMTLQRHAHRAGHERDAFTVREARELGQAIAELIGTNVCSALRFLRAHRVPEHGETFEVYCQDSLGIEPKIIQDMIEAGVI